MNSSYKKVFIGFWAVTLCVSLSLLELARASAAPVTCATVTACLLGTNTLNGAGVEGQATSSYGVLGISNSGPGLEGKSATGFGLIGDTSENATSLSTSRAGVLGQDKSTNKNAFNSGVAGVSPYGMGVLGQGGKYGGYFTSSASGGLGLYAQGAYIDGPSTTIIGEENGLLAVPDAKAFFNTPKHYYPGGGTALIAVGVVTDLGGNIIDGDDIFAGTSCGPTGSNGGNVGDPNDCGEVVNFDAFGNAIFAGTVTQSSTALFRTRSRSGEDVASFGPRASAPTLEDEGEAKLINGFAYVRLNSAFAATIDSQSRLLVFVTPEGDSNGVYTSNVSASGFSVHENRGGHSAVSFDYRIVAKPLDTKEMYLPKMSSFPSLKKRVGLPGFRGSGVVENAENR